MSPVIRSAVAFGVASDHSTSSGLAEIPSFTTVCRAIQRAGPRAVSTSLTIFGLAANNWPRAPAQAQILVSEFSTSTLLDSKSVGLCFGRALDANSPPTPAHYTLDATNSRGL